MQRSGRWVLIGVGTVVVLSVVAAVIASTRGTADLDTATPEGVVQAFLLSVADDEGEEGLAFLDQELRSRCEDPEFREFPSADDQAFRAELLEIEVDADRATVDVRITDFTGEPPFGGPGYDHDERYELTRTAEGWRITDFSWPYSPCPRLP